VRPVGPWTASVHGLLRHVRVHGAPWAPEPRGGDRVAFVEGEVPAYPMPGWVWEERVLGAAARLLRELHEATAGFGRAGRAWRSPPHEPDEVVCHNDFAPYNLVFRGGLPVAAIDFDHASPGPRAWDLAYLAYRLVPLAAPGNPDLPEAGDRDGRLARLCAAYGGVEAAEVLAVLPRRLRELAAISPPEHAALYLRDAEQW
jgi:aminoglycoside phosphotransferase (APT) family kinase protein